MQDERHAQWARLARLARRPLQAVARLCLAGLLALLAPGCTVVQLKAESRDYYESTILTGRVEPPPGWQGPVIVGAHRRPAPGAPGAVVHHTRLHEAGGYELIVPQGDYTVFAFADLNDNGTHDPGEPAGAFPGLAPVSASGTGVMMALDFALTADTPLPAGVAASLPLAPLTFPRHSTQAGAPADLDAAPFSAENGLRGYWSPMASFKDTGGNIYFLEPYDPGRIPVLFVHGAAGSAQDWRRFVQQLDRRRFQAWIFQYPSGASVESMANLLFWKLHNLQLRHRFERLCITAHSMGGLVVRSLLLDHGAQLPQVRLFVSLSTPWAGEASADLGVRHSPAVVPSWRDMQPEGPFMQALFARPLPPGVEHHLLFGYRGGYSLLRPNNDGTVTLDSQLRRPAQSEARMVYGFDEDHTSILSSPQVLAQYRSLIERLDERGGPAGGRLQLDYRFDGGPAADAGLPVQPVLLLAPVGAAVGADAVQVPLSPADNGRALGPLPAGTYDASLLAAAWQSHPRSTRVSIGPGSTPALSVRFTPQGSLWSYVAEDASAYSAPAGSFRRPHASVQIERISLRGAGVQRSLVPRQGGPADVLPAFLRGEDDAVGPSFLFVGLPEGDYELSITARGYRPYMARHRVVPGQQGPVVPVILQPLP